nr:MAG TPA: hypothetical protein [Caudoviricetes sp.]
MHSTLKDVRNSTSKIVKPALSKSHSTKSRGRK